MSSMSRDNRININENDLHCPSHSVLRSSTYPTKHVTCPRRSSMSGIPSQNVQSSLNIVENHPQKFESSPYQLALSIESPAPTEFADLEGCDALTGRSPTEADFAAAAYETPLDTIFLTVGILDGRGTAPVALFSRNLRRSSTLRGQSFELATCPSIPQLTHFTGKPTARLI
ncbi:hypothetical protein FF38_02468 [Lucilia cuprina]|uniref:Uncharacterized protein n=1 Tax=Lucilia cuprina TaxID=7375 RepID=A0A0L0BTQ5_LUCCU|nr:hypothetical protein FF38_02468 [Lucilia cuprina]